MAGENLGRAELELATDQTGLDKGLDAAKRKSASFLGEVKAGFTGASGSILQGVGISVGQMAFGVVRNAIANVADFVRDATKAFIEDERAQAGLRTALQQNVAAWDGNYQAIERLISARQRLGFEDNEQRESLARLVAVTRDENEALALNRTAMDFARLRQIDLATASDILGKVYGGNIGILSRYGIQLERGATATEALAEIQRMATGQAEAYANTTEGKLLAANIKIGDSTERIGRIFAEVQSVVLPAIADGFETVANAIGDVLDTIQDTALPEFISGLGTLVDVVGKVVSPLLAVHGAIVNIARGLGPLGVAFRVVLDPLGLFFDVLGLGGKVVGAVADGIHGLLTVVDDALGISRGQAAAAAAAAERSSAEIARAMDHRRGEIGEGAKRVGSAIETPIQAASDGAYSAVDTNLKAIADVLTRRRSEILSAASDVADATWDPTIKRAELALVKLELKSKEHLDALKSDDKKERLEAQLHDAELRKQRDLLTAEIAQFQIDQDKILENAIDRRDRLEEQQYLDRLSDSGAFARAALDEMREQQRLRTEAIKTAVDAQLDEIERLDMDLYDDGLRTGTSYAKGFRGSIGALRSAVQSAATAIGRYLEVRSPAEEGRLSELGGPEGWGRRFGGLYAGGIRSSIRDIVASTAAAASAAVRLQPSASMGLVGPSGGAGTLAAVPAGAGRQPLAIHINSPFPPSRSQIEQLVREYAPDFAVYFADRGLMARR